MSNTKHFVDQVLTDVNLNPDYVAIPQDNELFTLKEQISSYHHPEYETAEYVKTEIVSVDHFRLRKNVGRFKGNDQKVYDTVAKSLEKGYKVGKLPPIVLQKEDGELENWLVNGNHRHAWYRINGYSTMIVDVYRMKEGVHEEDVMDEIGLLHQPQPDGTSSCYEDYKARGIAWVERQRNDNIIVTQESVDTWVDKYAANECSSTRANLKKHIGNNTVKQSWMTNYTRPEVVKLYDEHGFTITDRDKKIKGQVVNRLFEASQTVGTLRGFLPNFLRNAAAGIKTRLHFYINTNKVKDGAELLRKIDERIAEIEDVLESLESFDKGNTRLRDFLEYGYRPPHIIDTDQEDTLIPLVKVKEKVVEDAPVSMSDLTLMILKSKFSKDVFTASQAYDAIRPIRTSVSKFKDEASFRGTILRELQVLAEKGLVIFLTIEKRGLYRIA